MLNLLTKTKPWMVASLLVATSVFGQDAGASSQKSGMTKEMKGNNNAPKACPTADCKPKTCPPPCPQPCPPTQLCPAQPAACCPPWPVPVLNAAYNYPARTQTRCPWDIFVDASFIYWQPLQDNMEFAIVADLPTNRSVSTNLIGNTLQLDFDYKPGFKIGLGGFFDYDNWDLHAEYTWFHTRNHKSSTIDPVALPSQAIFALWLDDNFSDRGAVGVDVVFNSASAKWRMNMDIVQLDLGRWHYVGTKLVFHPTFGARAAWIRQNYNIVYGNVAPFGVGVAQTETVKDRSHSWAVGPEVGLDAYWNLGEGFRLFGCTEFDILYTRYTRLSYNQYFQSAGTNQEAVQTVGIKEKNLGVLRPHFDINMGFGWGTYWDCNNWYTDIALGYEFQVFFEQNMLNGVEGGNLYTQGLTATFGLTF